MKKALSFIFACFTFATTAQSPAGFNYQGIVRGTDGLPVPNKSLVIKFDITQGSANGNVVHSEQQTITTTSLGLLNTQISGATLNQVNWNNGPYFLKVLVDLAGNGTFDLLGTQQLMSVPYALHAAQVPGTYVPTTNELTIGGNTFTLNASPVTTLTASGIVSVTSAGVGSSLIAVPSPSFTSLGPVNITGVYPNLVVNSPTNTPTTTINGTGNIQITNPSTNSFVITVPQMSVSMTSTSSTSGISGSGTNSININLPTTTTPIINGAGNVQVTNPASNSYLVTVPQMSVSLTSTSTTSGISGSGTNSVNINLPNAITPTINGAGALSVLPATVGNNFTLTVPQTSITVTQSVGTATVSSAGTNSFNINMPPQIVPTVTANGLATSTTTANNTTINVTPYTYVASTGIMSSGTNNLNITQALSLSGSTLTSGPASNTVDLGILSPWTINAGNIVQSNTLSNVGIGIIAPLQKLHVNGNIGLDDGTANGPSRVIGFPTPQAGNHGTLTVQAKGNVNSGTIYSGGVLLLSAGDYNHATSPTSGYGGHVYIRTGKNVFNGTGGADIIFLAGGSSTTHYERMRIRGNNGYVGINTNSPTEMLQVGSYALGQDIYVGVKTAGSNSYKAGIKLNHFQDDDGFTIESNETVNRLDIIRNAVTSSTVMSFSRTSDNIGMGSLFPTAKLHIVGSLRLENGSQANGRVLTSDASGNATWQAPTSRKRSIVIDPNMVDLTLSSTPPTKAQIGAWTRPCINLPDGTVTLFVLNIPVPSDWNTASTFTIRTLYASPGTTGNFVIIYGVTAVGLNTNAASPTSNAGFAIPASTTAEGLMEHAYVITLNSTDKMIEVYIRRDGGNPSDTSTQPMHFYGMTLDYMD